MNFIMASLCCSWWRTMVLLVDCGFISRYSLSCFHIFNAYWMERAKLQLALVNVLSLK